ncbi:MAG: NADPH-dependent oxidoreductase [Chitinophagaceae bacterium]|jgi:NAD(P)H-dependent FMN reductase|nr:NAD(P)H-dependent oxidoreductase [Sphingobacteriales bacterium]OJV97671.1 MAG: NADPH-dependent FMN reductase [Sphingobacteriales bacterium 44-61]TXJ26340.1 MAG: NADPH-dependent oxidoreductase [Chitinophagaceae bacterium]
MRIEIISGSPRPNSITRRVALHLQHWIDQNTPHEAGLIDMKDWELPVAQTVFVSVEKTPEQFRPLSERIFGADAFILLTPEYNGSYSPAMKNLLDHYPKQHHKPFGIVTASPGSLGGLRASQQLLLLIPALFGLASPYLLIVPFVEQKFLADGTLVDESFANKVHNFMTEFIWLAEKLLPERISV